jgi:SlyX protein
MVLLQFASNQLECRRFSGAIAADQANALARLDCKISLGQYFLVSEVQRHRFKTNQGHSIAGPAKMGSSDAKAEGYTLKPRPCWLIGIEQKCPPPYCATVAGTYGEQVNDDKLIDLESKLAHQEYLLAELNDVVTSQQAQITQLETLCRSLIDRVKSLSESGVAAADEKPPHY